MGDTPWTTAEQRLIDEFGKGIVSFETSRPEKGSDENTLRASLIRHLILEDIRTPIPGGVGVEIRGAYVTGTLDLEMVSYERQLYLASCTFEENPVLVDCRLHSLLMPGCGLPGLHAHRLRTEGPVYLRNGFRAKGTVDLNGAHIGGALDCTKGLFEATPEGIALDCNAMTVGASVFLRDGFCATGQVCLLRATITGQLACVESRFEATPHGMAFDCDAIMVGADVFLRDGFHATGKVDFQRARVEGHLQVFEARLDGPVNLRQTRIGAEFSWQSISSAVPLVDLTGAYAKVLKDETAAWEQVKELELSGFTYDALDSQMRVAERLKWLEKDRADPIVPIQGDPLLDPERFNQKAVRQANQGAVLAKRKELVKSGAYAPDFDPQPYVQLAQVLSASGNRSGAARVLEQKEYLQLLAARRRSHAQLDGDIGLGLRSLAYDIRKYMLLDWFFRWAFGYGHAPGRAVIASLGFVLLGAFIAHNAFIGGQMAPNSDVILTSQGWLDAIKEGCAPLVDAAYVVGCTQPLTHWLEHAPAAKDYETFSPLLYGLDLFVPLDALGQETTWAPTKGRGMWGEVLYKTRWMFQSAGWIITALAAAVLTGLVGRRD